MLSRLLLAVSVASVLLAQAPAPEEAGASGQEPVRFRAQGNEVIVPVTVTDDKGRFVNDLEAGDFHIYDQGREQKITFFSRDRNQPVVVGFLLDLSNATRLHWKTFQEAALEMVFNLMPGDKRFSGYLITYSNEAELAVNTASDSEKIVERIRKLKPGGGAALFDAIYMGCTKRSLISGEPIQPRRIMIIVGDGHDNASSKSLGEVLELAQRNLVTIYGISTTAFGAGSEGDSNLRRLCEETGGRVEYPLQDVYKDVAGFLSTPSDEGNYALKVGTGQYSAAIAKGIFDSVVALVGEVTTQYILHYVPNVSAEESSRPFRDLTVAVDLPNVKIRHRKFYYPVNP